LITFIIETKINILINNKDGIKIFVLSREIIQFINKSSAFLRRTFENKKYFRGEIHEEKAFYSV
ncbi:hypothetical protein B1689_14340, partial [Geobacillus sp. 44C]